MLISHGLHHASLQLLFICYLACMVQNLEVRWVCHRVQRARGHRLPILLLPLRVCPRRMCHCQQLILELLALPKQAPTWVEHWEALPNLAEKMMKMNFTIVKFFLTFNLQLYIISLKSFLEY